MFIQFCERPFTEVTMKADPVQAQLIELRRNQILQAAAQVFAQKGFHRATIRDVAKAAGVADGTIYNYFENKTDLLVGMLNMINQSDEREDHFAQVGEISPDEWARWYVRERFVRLQTDGHDVFRVLLPEMLTNAELRRVYMQEVIQPTYETAERYYKQWADQGLVRDLDPALTLRALSGMFLGMLVMRLLDDPVLEERWDELPDLMTEIMLNGIKGVRSDES
jgi:AcrR family transcriptional regulator